MINKFRYKKPQQTTNNNNAKNCSKNENTCDNSVNCKSVKQQQQNQCSDNQNKNNETNSAGVLTDDERKKLKELFSQLQFSTETALPPDALRRALAESFFDQQRFQLGFMDDAAECFENMLLRIHMHIAHGEAEDMCNAKHCIPHQKFAMTLVEQSICESCGATSEPLSYTQMVHYVSTSTLVYQVRANNGRPQNDTFGQLLRKAGNMGDVRVCPSACGAVIQIGRTLMNHPEIVSIGLVWNSERPSLEHIMEVFSTIGTTLRLGDVFNTVGDNRWSETSIHNLVGVVTYYGKHYSTFFFHTKLRVWIYFDDATVREVGPRWDQVVEKCRKGRYQPLLLLYALPDGTPVNTENAPKQITAFYNDKVTKKPPQSVLRRSVTPSPEKPIIGNTRRAITPNPDGSLNQKPPLPRPYNEYQNLSVIQKNIYETKVQSQEGDVVDGCLNRKEPEYVSKRALDFTQPLQKPQVNIFRTLSSGSSSGVEGMSIPDHMNVPRRRDSGNWSGDRNSASSSSSTTMENPYLYLVGKVPHGGGSVPGSPTRSKSDSSSGSSGVYDAGYDSYSLSSNDSSTMTTLQHLMKMGHLAQIPEDYNNVSNQVSQSCDVLCDEADELLVKSRQLEDEHDLVLALALCNAAATKARAAMNAPYNNPQTLTLARMKHNTCIMRARGLHRRMTQTQNMQNKDNPPEIRHTREGSSGSGRHSRQNSRDKGLHSRQNSRELLVTEKEKVQPTKNIEIYATLPKKKDALKSKLNSIHIEDNNDYALYDKPPSRESRSIFSRSKNKESHKMREKRSRSEDRNKITRDFSIAPEITNGKDTLKKAKDEKEDKKEKDGKQKKQHKIRRKLLMGGLIKRKNRSMPDLTDANAVDNATSVHQVPTTTVDDSNIGLKGNLDNQTNNMCGYLSEGHLEFSGNNANPNLERSKLMRKSFHGSAGKILTAAKVPPPPPLRTTSQLSKAKSNGGEVCEEKSERPQYPLPNNVNHYQNTQYYDVPPTQKYKPELPVSLPYISNYQNYDYNSNQASPYNTNTIVTRADVHQEQSPLSPNYNNDSGVDEVDCLPSSHHTHNLELPPYPSPIGSAIHSRQASEEFPPPPPPLDLSALEDDLPKPSPPPTPSPGSLLAQLQDKRQQILTQDSLPKRISEPVKSSGETWLRELQAKQAALRLKKSQNTENSTVTEDNTSKVETKNTVKDLASKFETSESTAQVKALFKPQQNSFDLIKTDSSIHNGVLSLKKREEHEPIAPEQIAEEIREVELLNAAVHKTLNGGLENEENKKTRLGKKKSVSFCDQVILVATAEEQEDDSYIPNPILERVLRTAMTKPETANIRQEIINLREADGEEEEGDVVDGVRKCVEEEKVPQQPLYVRRNSVDNILTRQNSSCGTEQFYNQNNHYGTQNQQIVHQSPINSPNGYHNSPNNTLYNYPQPPYTHQNGYNNNNSPYNGGYNVQNSYNSNQIISQESPQYTAQNNAHHVYPPTSQYGSYNNHNAAYNTANNIQNNQYNGHTPYRQSPYQPLPQNSPAYTAYYANKANTIQNPRQSQDYHTQQYSPSQRNGFNQQTPQIRQSTPSPMHVNNYPNTPIYHHPPSPAPSNVSSNYNYNHRLPPNNNYDNSVQYSPYQRVPMPEQRTANHIETDTFHRHPKYIQDRPDPYQRVPPLHHEQETYIPNNNGKYSPYQQALIPKQILKKTVSFEPGTKGGCESPTPKAVITPIIVNNANNSVPTDKTKCNLCRKKNVVAANLYCTDCEFYMSRFKPRC